MREGAGGGDEANLSRELERRPGILVRAIRLTCARFAPYFQKARPIVSE